jgi:MSHA biogenesis protein MshP
MGRKLRANCLNISFAARQSGFLVPLALFIVVGAATLAVSMSQMAAGSRSSAVLTAFSTQALYSADAGVQMAMHQLYYGNDDQSSVDAACVSVNGSSFNLSGQGIAGCSVSVTCDVTLSNSGDVSLYSVVSQSECGSGDYEVGRRIRAEAYMNTN